MSHIEAKPIASGAFQPVVGETTTGLAEWLVRKGTFSKPADFEPVRRDALAIVSKCLPFDGPDGSRTGLVVGYVQSGKTVSMEAVSAIAADSGCRIIILLAGVTTNLLDQNAKRFTKDLREAGGRPWKIFNSEDRFNSKTIHKIAEEWRDSTIDDADRQILLLLVLKNHAHLQRLTELMKDLDLRGVPAIVLDDEADQAGLNTKVNQGDKSTTYAQIEKLRHLLPHHTYLQYTATPQAPLLITLDDMLSPAFAELVEPGSGYTGGKAFFGPGAPRGIVQAIPGDDLFKPGSPPPEPPESMLVALRVFFVGCAVAHLRATPRPRSMLVHPSARTGDHKTYIDWIEGCRDRWTSSLASTNKSDRDDALAEFREAYEDLEKTDSSLPAFEELAPQKLLRCLRGTLVKEVNSEDGSEVDWENADEHILVGGEKLNRGFTVEGLTVTYMPRDAGDWNADTIQQRARFFGYKKSYLTLCRLYLHPDVIHAFQAYVRHEEDVRSQLAKHRGRSLKEWRRAFFMDARMRPTRRNVLEDPFFRIKADRPWFVPGQPHIDLQASTSNAERVLQFEARCKFVINEQFWEHETCELELSKVFEELILEYQARGSDVPAWYGQLVMLRDVVEGSSDARVLVMRMRGSKASPQVRKRGPSVTSGKIKLHQGRSSAKGPDKYPGDAEMCDKGIVTIQIHWVRVEGTERALPMLAIHIPKALRKDDLVAKP